MSLQIEINTSTSKPELILEPKRKYMPLRKLDLQTAGLIKDEWHHAIITYFNLKPKFLGQFYDFPLNSTDIQNIKKYYGISPPSSIRICSEEKPKFSQKKELQKNIPTSLDILDFYSQGYSSNTSSIIECDEDPFIYSFDYCTNNEESININMINNHNIMWFEDYF